MSLSLPRFHPSAAIPPSSSSKHVQPNSPSTPSSTFSASSFHTPSAHRTSAPQPYIASPTNTALSPSQSRTPYAAYDDIPPIHNPSHSHTQPLPPKSILVEQPNGAPSIRVSLPPQPAHRAPPQHKSYFRTQQLTQAVAPVSPAALAMLRGAASSPSPDMLSSSGGAAEASRFSSHVSTGQSEYCEPSVVASQSRGSVSRRVSVNARLQPLDSAASSRPSPTPPLVGPAAASLYASGTPPSAVISLPTEFTTSSWSMFFLSLPASPIFLHCLSVALVSLHAALLFVSVLLFLLTLLPALSPMSQPLCFYLLFYAVKSAASLTMCAYRLQHPDCWQVDDVGSVPRSARYHVARHVLRCVSVASTGVVSWWLFAADDSLAQGTALGRYVLALLCLEYLSISLPLLSNLLLSFFVPCIHLSFYLPYLPFPALQSAAVAEEEADKGGMSEEDLTHLPSTRYHPSALPRDTTCAVCLSEVEDGEEVRQLTCRHMYHRPCIDEWLRKRGVCPLCVRKVSVKPHRARTPDDKPAAPGVEMGALASVDEVTLNVNVEDGAVVQGARYDVDLHPDQLEA